MISIILWKWYTGDLVQVIQERTSKLHKQVIQTPKSPIPIAPMPLLTLKSIAHKEGSYNRLSREERTWA